MKKEKLQQYLPLAVLKRNWILLLQRKRGCVKLQQYLPLAVLKPSNNLHLMPTYAGSCNSTYRLRYWNESWRAAGKWGRLQQYLPLAVLKLWADEMNTYRAFNSCNSTYRLRYWNVNTFMSYMANIFNSLQQYLPFTVLKPSTFSLFDDTSHLAVATVLTVYDIK